jgi:hypothetical protein
MKKRGVRREVEADRALRQSRLKICGQVADAMNT